MKEVRKRNTFGGISTVIVMALVIAASIAIAVYFIAYFIGLSSSVAGTAQAIATVGSFSTSGVSITVKNTGTVGIEGLAIEISGNETQYIGVYFKNGTNYLSIGSGNTITIFCQPTTTGLNCTASTSQPGITGSIIKVFVANGTPPSTFSDLISSTSTNTILEINAGQTYKVSVLVYYANGKTQLLALGTYTAS